MGHPNEDRLRELYAVFAKGDLQGWLDGCTDDVTFTVPGDTPGSGVFTKATFAEWITGVMTVAEGTFQEHVLDVYANDDHGVLLLRHEFDRAGIPRVYLTAHAIEFRDGLISRWEERPGSLVEFEEAWGRTDEAETDRQVEAFLARVAETWRSNDGDAMGATFTPDGSLINPFGERADGRDAVAAMYSAYFTGMLRGTTTSVRLRTVRPVAADHALIDVDQSILAPSGETVLECHLAALLRRDGADWRFADARPYVPAAPPA